MLQYAQSVEGLTRSSQEECYEFIEKELMMQPQCFHSAASMPQPTWVAPHMEPLSRHPSAKLQRSIREMGRGKATLKTIIDEG